MSGKNPARQLALHRRAWEECRELLVASGTSIPLRTSVKYAWRASLYSLAWQTLPKPAPVEALPVAAFICGYWRSGTTLLHEILAKDSRWRAPTTQECMNPGQQHTFAQRSKSVLRPMDNLTIGADTPQEDEFALLALGAPSFYRVLLCPKAWAHQAQELDPGFGPHLSEQRLLAMRELFGLMKAVDGRELLLKSPTHSFSLPRLLQEAPGASAIVIVRNWQALWPSCWRMWTAMFNLYAIGPWDSGDIEGLVRTTYEMYARAVQDVTTSSSADRVIAIRYEDLIASPTDVLQRIYSRFRWPLDDNLMRAAQAFLEATRPGPRGKDAHPSLSPETSAAMSAAYDAICRSLGSMLA